MAIAIVLTGLLAALQTPGWRIPAWSAGTAAIVFGLASAVFPDQQGAAGREWGGVFAVAEGEVRRTTATRDTVLPSVLPN